MKKTLITLAALAMASVASADFTSTPIGVNGDSAYLTDVNFSGLTFCLPANTTLTGSVQFASISFGGYASYTPDAIIFTLVKDSDGYSVEVGRNNGNYDHVSFDIVAGTNYTLSGTTASNHYMSVTLAGGENTSTKSFDSQIYATYVDGKLVNATTTFDTTYSPSTTGDNVPEPATATLSLLALAGLAARRRRK